MLFKKKEPVAPPPPLALTAEQQTYLAALKDKQHHTHHDRVMIHRLEALQALYDRKPMSKPVQMVYGIGKGVVVGAVFAHAVLAASLWPPVQNAVASAFGGLVAGRVAFWNIMQGWAGGAAAKIFAWKGYKPLRDKQGRLNGLKKPGGIAKLVDDVMDPLEDAAHVANVELYQAQNRKLTKRQVTGAAVASVLRAVAVSAPAFAIAHYVTHGLWHHNVAAAGDPVLQLQGVKSATLYHMNNVASAVHAQPFLDKAWAAIEKNAVTGVPDKVIGAFGMILATGPVHLIAENRRRKVACKYVAAEKTFRRHLGLPRPQLEAAIRAEREWQDYCKREGRPIVTRPRDLTRNELRRARAEATGHAPATAAAAGLQ